MRNLRLKIEYDGARYRGWQSQRGNRQSAKRKTKTLQETIEKALQRILREKINLIGSGRTDAGVHALAQVANFQANSGLPLKKIQQALNALLPGDIAVGKVQKVNLDFHSRFAAKAKLYRYLILNRSFRSAFLRERVYFYPRPLDIKLMRRAARCLLGRHNFKAFCASGSSVKNTVRTLKRVTVRRIKDTLTGVSLIAIEIEAEGFLYNMARNIVGTLMEIGRGKFAVESLKKILLSQDRKLAGPTAPARGLYLVGVKNKTRS